MEIFYIHLNSGNKVFVKTKDFFESQGGFTENWGRYWYPIYASSIEDARDKGYRYFNVLPRGWLAKGLKRAKKDAEKIPNRVKDGFDPHFPIAVKLKR